jgi:hypothetical protein
MFTYRREVDVLRSRDWAKIAAKAPLKDCFLRSVRLRRIASDILHVIMRILEVVVKTDSRHRQQDQNSSQAAHIHGVCNGFRG